MKINKVEAPTNDYMNGFRASYFLYILKGVSDLNIPLVRNKDLNSISGNYREKSYFLLDFYYDDKKQRVWYDWSDFQRFVFPEVLVNNTNDLYFKVECNDGHMQRYKIKPIGHGVTDIDIYFNNLEKNRKLVENTNVDILGLFRATSPNPGLKSERINACEKIIDLPYNTIIGVDKCSFRPEPSLRLQKNIKMSYNDFLKQTAQSKINLLLPGIGELTWRISETLGIGACGLMPKLTTVLPGNPENCWIEVKRDYSDLLEKIDYYLTHEEERKTIAKNGLKYFEEWLSPQAQVKNIIREIKNVS